VEGGIQDWQTTGLFINENTTLTDGQWTYWPNHAPYNAGEGWTYICVQVVAAAQCVEPLPEFPAGALICISDMIMLSFARR
jgi:hypothetical protein